MRRRARAVRERARRVSARRLRRSLADRAAQSVPRRIAGHVDGRSLRRRAQASTRARIGSSTTASAAVGGDAAAGSASAPSAAGLRAARARRRDTIFDNGLVRARVAPTGEILELAVRDGAIVVERANRLTIYRDRPAKWEAWNVDAGYRALGRSRCGPQPAERNGGALEVSFDAGRRGRAARCACP